MIVDHGIRLAVRADAAPIAVMSRETIERGLDWRWRPARVLASILDPDTCVPVAHESGRLHGFAIMKYKQDEGHLLLLAVDPARRRRGEGTALLSWLESTALTAGIGVVYLEARARSPSARAFYRARGYREFQVVRGYYQGREDCVRLGKDLWANVP